MFKAKSFLLAVGVVLAVAFTFSCSSDGGEGGFGDRGGDKSGGGNGGSETEISSSSLRISSSSVGSSQGGGISSSVGGGGGSTCSANFRTVKIGSQTWMAENLNCNPGTGNSACYNNQASNCSTYGRLYDWETAKTVCPSGWHLPTKEEWDVLGDDARKLKARSGWNNNGNGTDQYGFSALPGGYGDSGGKFDFVGQYGCWWSASDVGSRRASARYMHYDDEYAGWSNDNKSILFSVRCLQD